MKFDYIEDPFVLIIKDIFPKETNQKILEEAITLKKKFKLAETSGDESSWLRTNTMASYDVIYKDKRQDSVLLNSIDDIFRGKNYQYIRDVIISSPTPICLLTSTNKHETQVSRYGGKGQRYGWHTDNLGGSSRLISLVYHFFQEPAKFKGGEIRFSSSPNYDDKLIHDNYKSIKIENNTAYFFSSNISHSVTPTTSSSIFNHGRFSVNCWIGMN